MPQKQPPARTAVSDGPACGSSVSGAGTALLIASAPAPDLKSIITASDAANCVTPDIRGIGYLRAINRRIIVRNPGATGYVLLDRSRWDLEQSFGAASGDRRGKT